MNWDDLRVFLAVAETGSVRGAARKIGKTHATVSRHIQCLQQSVGNPLFERRREGQCLTALGQQILPLAQDIENSVAAIDRAAFSADKDLAGPVNLSLPESLYLALLYRPIDEFMHRFPMINLNVTATDHLSKLALREADVVIRITREPPELAYGRKLADSPLATFASPAYLQTRPERDRWISYGYRPAQTPSLPAKRAASADTAIVATKMLALGQGVGLLPCYLGDTNHELIRVPDTKPIADMQIWVLTHGDLRTNARVRILMDFLYSIFDDYRPIIEGERPISQ